MPEGLTAPPNSSPETPADDDSRSQSPGRRDLIDVGFRHMRLVAALLLFPFVLAYDPAAGIIDLPISNLLTAIALSLTLLGTNALSLLDRQLVTGSQRTGLAVLVVCLDALTTTFFAVLMSGSSEVAWFLVFVPVLEAGMKFGLISGLGTWIALSTTALAVEWLYRPGYNLSENLTAVAGRMGIVLLVAIPGIHLAQRLLIDIRTERIITNEAQQRSHLLETVAQSSQRVGRLDAGMVEEVLNSAILLGLDIADICVRGSDGRWRVEASRTTQHGIDLPDPNTVATPTLQTAAHSAEVSRVGDDSVTDSTLRRSGLSSLVVSALGGDGLSSVILRGGRALGRPMTKTIADCVELLAGNATIALQNKRLVGELRAMQARLHHQAYHDALTGLANRTRFIDALEQRLRECRNVSGECAVAFVDLDRFKPVNDSLGHEVGNELLIAVGRRLQGVTASSDLVARFGGDEFVVLVNDLSPTNPQEQLDRLGKGICEAISTPFTVSGHEAVISCSVGIAQATGSDLHGMNEEAGDVVRRADLAMYRAKGQGKDRWAYYQADLDEELINRIRLETDLRHAIQSFELGVAYQGIRSLRDGRTVAAEALLRWTHPEFGPQNPEHIIPLAEDSGLILELGELVLTTACDQAAAWQRNFANPPAVSINVSPRQLFHPQFLPMFDNVLNKTRANPAGIILEITENIVGQGTDFAEILHQVGDRRVQLALDDFGQGQTSLRHLRTLPLDLLKIDKTFVSQGESNSEDEAILEAIIKMAHHLGLLVIAEGIESRRHLHLLKRLGCDLVQGFLLHRPSSPSEMEVQLGATRREPASMEETIDPIEDPETAHERLLTMHDALRDA